MAKATTREELGALEEQFLPRYLLNFSLFGYRIRLTYNKQRWAQPVRKRIAVVVMHHESAWARRVTKGLASSFTGAMGPDELPVFDVLSADARVDYLHSDIFPHLEQHRSQYAAVVTVGTWVSKLVREYMREHDWQATQVFLGVHDPVGAGLVANVDIPNKNIVGVVTQVIDYGRYVKLLKNLRHNVRTVLIPYDPDFVHEGFDDEKQRLTYHLERNGIQLRTLTVGLHDNVAEQLEPHLANIDVVWSLHEAATQLHAKKIAKMCDKNDVTFCASDLACVFQGAAIGVGDSGTLTGSYGGQLCFALATGQDKHRILKNIDLCHPTAMRVNPSFIHKQGIELDSKSLAFIEDVVPLGWE